MRIAIIVFLFIFSTAGYSQEQPKTSSSEGNQSFHRYEFYGSAFLHTNGFGAGIYKAKRITGFKKRVLALEFLNLKHAKEYKSSSFSQNGGSFFYGKLNSAFLLRPTISFQKILYTKDAKKGVQLSYALYGGPTLAFLKPIYLEIISFSTGLNDFRKIEKFDPNVHSFDNIIGKAPSLTGLEETKLLPGLHAKFGLNFEYSPHDDILRAIETGVAMDGFIKKVPIMAYETNRQFYFTFYINFNFGRKTYQ